MEGKLTIFLLLVLGKTSVQGFDPCKTTEVLRFQDQRCPSNQLRPGYAGLCDNFITEKWYRVDDGADIPTSCPSMLQCGTMFPVWMYGTVPSVSDGLVYRTACVSDYNSCCSRQWLIHVKNCGSYRVYHLKGPDACSSAYCIEKRSDITTALESSSSSSSSEDATSAIEPTVEIKISNVTTTDVTTTGNLATSTSTSATLKSISSTEKSTTEVTTNGSLATSISRTTTLKSTSFTEQSTTSQRRVTSAETQGVEVTDPNIVNRPDLEAIKTSSTSSTESTKSHVVQQDTPSALVYVLAGVIGILVLIILFIAVIVRRSRRSREEKEKSNRETSVSTIQSKNSYSELPDPDTIYYSIDYEKENESNLEKDKNISTLNENMYLDPYQPSIRNDEVKYDEATEIQEINSIRLGLESREMYLDAYRKSVTSSSGNEVSERRESTYNHPYECTEGRNETHYYAKLTSDVLKKRPEFVNNSYESE